MRAEDEAAVARDARHASEARKLADAGIALGKRHPEQAAIEAIGPGVIRAAQLPQVAARLGDDARAAVGAAVVQQRKRSVLLPREDHFFRSQARQHIVAGGRHLALMSDVEPDAAEDALLFEREHMRVDVCGAMHALAAH